MFKTSLHRNSQHLASDTRGSRNAFKRPIECVDVCNFRFFTISKCREAFSFCRLFCCIKELLNTRGDFISIITRRQ